MSTQQLNRRRRWGVALLAFVSVLAFFAPAALAQEEPEAVGPDVFLIDDSGRATDVYLRTIEPVDVLDLEVNGEAVTQKSVQRMSLTGEPTDTVIVIDNSELSENDNVLEDLRAAAISYVNSRDLNERISIITAGGNAKIRRGFTNSIDAASSSLISMVPSGQPALWDGMHLAAGSLSISEAPVRNIVVFTAHSDRVSTTTAAAARGSAVTANATIWVVGARAETLNDADLARAVELTGGTLATTADFDELSGLAGDVGDRIKNTYLMRISQELPIEEGANRMTLTVGGASTTVGFAPEAVTSGGALAPASTPEGGGSLGFLKTDRGRTISVLLGAVAAALAAFAFALLFEKDTSGLNAVLSPYAGDGAAAAEKGSGLGKHAVFARAFQITENFAESRGVLSRTESALERADLPLRAAEALTFYAGAILITAVLTFLWTQNLIVVLLFVGLLAMAGPAFVNYAAARRKKKFMAQLPDTLQLLSGTLKAGYSFMQGLEAVSQESEDPMGEELRRIVTEAQLGRPVEEALDTAAERMDSPDFAWAVMAVKIQREVGGNLAELLLTVSETMVARERLRRDVASLTAEGRISAIVLGALPILLGMAMWAINPEYVGVLFTEKIGNIMLIVSVIAALAGFAWMKKIITIEI